MSNASNLPGPLSKDFIYTLTFSLIVPTNIAAVIANLWVAITMVNGGRRLLCDRLSLCILALVVSCCINSLMGAANPLILEIAYPDRNLQEDDLDSFNKATKIMPCLQSIAHIGIIGSNVCLALERYFMIRQANNSTKNYFGGIIVMLISISILLISAYVTTDVSAFLPVQSPQHEIVFYCMCFVYLMGAVSIVALYISTFAHVKKVLSELPPEKDDIKNNVKRTTLISCVIMSSSVLVVYVPGLVFFISSQRIEIGADISIVLFELASLDSLITPILVIYCVPAVREAILSFGRRLEPVISVEDQNTPCVVELGSISSGPSSESSFIVANGNMRESLLRK